MAEQTMDQWSDMYRFFLAPISGSVIRIVCMKKDGKFYTIKEDEEDAEVQYEIIVPMEEFVMPLLDLEGELEYETVSLKVSEDAGWVLFALVDLIKRTRCKSLMEGTPVVDVTINPMEIVETLEKELFPGVDDMRFLSAFLSVSMGIRAKPDLKKAKKDLTDAEFLDADGVMTPSGRTLVNTFAEIYNMLGLYGRKRDNDKIYYEAVFLNCYHSLWSISFDQAEKAFYLTSMSRKRLQEVLKSIFS